MKANEKALGEAGCSIRLMRPFRDVLDCLVREGPPLRRTAERGSTGTPMRELSEGIRVVTLHVCHERDRRPR